MPETMNVGHTLAQLTPYLWRYKWRVLAALACLVLAKVATVSVPLVFKAMIDDLSTPQFATVLPLLLLGLYGALRFASSLLGGTKNSRETAIITPDSGRN